MISSVKKGSRSKNVSEAEKKILLDLIQPKLSIIENIKTDGTTNKIKGITWQNVTNSYNALQTTGVRTTVQLKAMFDTMKRISRKDKSIEKVNTYISNPNVQTERERELLTDLISSNKLCIDPSVSTDIQDNVWKTITELYNSLQTSGLKTAEELKIANKNLCLSAKSDLNKEKREVYKTGGGQPECHSSSLSAKVIGIMGERFQCLESPQDCDGDYPQHASLLRMNDKYQDSANDTNVDTDDYEVVGIDDIDKEIICDSENIVVQEYLDKSGGFTVNNSIQCDNVKLNEGQQFIAQPIQNFTSLPSTSTPKRKLSQRKLIDIKDTTRTPYKKVYDNLQDFTSRRMDSYAIKDNFLENYNILKIKKAEIQLETAELEHKLSIERLRAEREHNISLSKQDELKEEILKYELKKNQGSS